MSLLATVAPRAAGAAAVRHLCTTPTAGGSLASKLESALKGALERAVTQKSTNPHAVQMTTEQMEKHFRAQTTKKVEQLAKKHVQNKQTP